MGDWLNGVYVPDPWEAPVMDVQTDSWLPPPAAVPVTSVPPPEPPPGYAAANIEVNWWQADSVATHAWPGVPVTDVWYVQTHDGRQGWVARRPDGTWTDFVARHKGRGLFGGALDFIGDAVGDAVDAVGDAVGDAVDAVGDAVGGAVSAAGDAATAVADAAGDAWHAALEVPVLGEALATAATGLTGGLVLLDDTTAAVAAAGYQHAMQVGQAIAAGADPAEAIGAAIGGGAAAGSGPPPPSLSAVPPAPAPAPWWRAPWVLVAGAAAVVLVLIVALTPRRRR